MIVTRLDGGLGNQMFQYAYGLQVARMHNAVLKLDVFSLPGQAHPWALAKPLSNRRSHPERCRPRIAAKAISSQLQDHLVRLVRPDALRRVKENLLDLHNAICIPTTTLIWWDTGKVSSSSRCTPDVREQFQLLGALSSESQIVADRLQNTASLALHVRRGDYLSNPQAAAIYRNLSVDYYRRAVLARLTERTGVEVTVFSNDIAWCQVFLKLPCPTRYVTDSAGAHEELMLMSAAESIVIANSTFSWWAAWLSNRQNLAYSHLASGSTPAHSMIAI